MQHVFLKRTDQILCNYWKKIALARQKLAPIRAGPTPVRIESFSCTFSLVLKASWQQMNNWGKHLLNLLIHLSLRLAHLNEQTAVVVDRRFQMGMQMIALH